MVVMVRPFTIAPRRPVLRWDKPAIYCAATASEAPILALSRGGIIPESQSAGHMWLIRPGNRAGRSMAAYTSNARRCSSPFSQALIKAL